MKLSSLVKLVSGEISASDYSAEIRAELAEHSRGLAVAGGIAPVSVTQDSDILLDRAALSALCRLFATGQLTAQEFAYTADALQLADRVVFSGQDIADDLGECTDPEMNGQLTVARALEIAGSGAAA